MVRMIEPRRWRKREQRGSQVQGLATFAQFFHLSQGVGTTVVRSTASVGTTVVPSGDV